MIILIISTPNSHLLSIKYVDDNWLKKLKCHIDPPSYNLFFFASNQNEITKKGN